MRFFLFLLASGAMTAAAAADNYSYAPACGSVSSTPATTAPAVLLIGGAEADSDGELAATDWFLNQGGNGNYLVLRTGGTGGQASWLCSQFGQRIASAAELSVDSRAAANNPDVVAKISEADMLFITGGDQTTYVSLWRDTALASAINAHMNHKPIAGTSAGMAILGGSYYAPATLGVLSSEILDDPFHPFSADIGHGDFLAHPMLAQVITDTHLDRRHGPDQEFRYGRLFAFLARSVNAHPERLRSLAIGAEEAVFVAIDGAGQAQVFSAGGSAWFLVQNQAGPEQIVADQPLIWSRDQAAVKAYRIVGSPTGQGQFNLDNWTEPSGGEWLDWYSSGGQTGFNFSLGQCSGCDNAEPPSALDGIFTDRFEQVPILLQMR